MKNGYTLIELLIAVAVLMVVLVFSIATFYNITKRTDLDASRDDIISTLNIARNKTLASEGAKHYGVYFDASISPNRYVFFRGLSYAGRDVSFDEIYDLNSSVKISSTSFNGGGNEVVFKLLEGNTDNYGSITIQSLATSETRIIYVYSFGEVSTQPESVSGAGRVRDSRHVHFDLGNWSIVGATFLKFDFINAAQIESVLIDDYFTSTSFDWEGEFSVNETPQKFRVHTHQLTPITRLCIHRDRNKGINTEEVYIYIIQDSAEKEIALYLADVDDTVEKGSYVYGSMEKQ